MALCCAFTISDPSDLSSIQVAYPSSLSFHKFSSHLVSMDYGVLSMHK